MARCLEATAVELTCKVPQLVSTNCRMPDDVVVAAVTPYRANLSGYIFTDPLLQVGGGYSDFQDVRSTHIGDSIFMSSTTGQGNGVDQNNWSGQAELWEGDNAAEFGLSNPVLIWRRYGLNPVGNPPGLSINNSLEIPIDYTRSYWLRLRVVNWVNTTLFVETLRLN